MRFFLVILFILFSIQTIFGQQNYLPLHSYYRDQILVTNRAETYAGDCMFPITEEEYNVYKYFKDSTVYYYEFPETIFKKHIIEVKDTDTYVKISPVIDFSYGKDLANQFKRNLFNNTRGFLAEVNLGKKIALFTTFYENQALFSSYEADYYKSRGEFYTLYSKYTQENAVIPGAGRTKAFKDTKYDYAYAIGYVNYKISKDINVSLGNNQHFIGAGYRSLLLSDNSYSSPYLQFDYKLNSKFKLHYWKSRNLNLVRKQHKTTVESYYQPKGNNGLYFSYQINNKLNIGFFESSIWMKGDSLNTSHLPIGSYNPVPILAIFFSDKQRYLLNGLNIDYVLNTLNRLYGQIVFGNLNFKNGGFQIGWRGNKQFKNKNILFQLEYNFVSHNVYQSVNHQIDYSNYNLSLAHPAGNSFHELLFRSSSEFKRYYYDYKLITYFFNNRFNNFLLPVRLDSKQENFFQVNNQIELGYRINKKLNWTVFLLNNFRFMSYENIHLNSILQIGMRTNLINHYNDF